MLLHRRLIDRDFVDLEEANESIDWSKSKIIILDEDFKNDAKY